MNVANIVPPKWINRYPYSTYGMALAHWIHEDREYGERMRANTKYLILDNGAFEDKTLSFNDLKAAIAICRPDEIVLPDVPGDGKATLKLSWSAFAELRPQRCMFVPQGRTYDEWTACLSRWLRNWGNRDEYLVIGVTPLRKLDSSVEAKGRVECLQFAAQTKRPIHLLGLASPQYFCRNILPIVGILGIRGLDTSIAFTLGANNVLFHSNAEKIDLGDPLQYISLSSNQRRLGWLNIAILDYVTKSYDYCFPGIPMSIIGKVAGRWTKYWLAGFAKPEVLMLTCGIPAGRYDVYDNHLYPLADDDEAEGELVIL